MPNFIKNEAQFSFVTKFHKFVVLGRGHSLPSYIFIISKFDLFWVPNFIKIRHTTIFEIKSAEVFNFGSRSAISNITFMINETDLFWVPNFIALEIYFIFRTKFSWNEGIDSCLVVAVGYCSLPGSYWWLLLVIGVTALYRWLLVHTFSMNSLRTPFLKNT